MNTTCPQLAISRIVAKCGSNNNNLSRTHIRFLQGMRQCRLFTMHKLAICCVVKEPWPKPHKSLLTSSFGQGMLEVFSSWHYLIFFTKTFFLLKRQSFVLGFLSMLNKHVKYWWHQLNTIQLNSSMLNWMELSMFMFNCSLLNSIHELCLWHLLPHQSTKGFWVLGGRNKQIILLW